MVEESGDAKRSRRGSLDHRLRSGKAAEERCGTARKIGFERVQAAFAPLGWFMGAETAASGLLRRLWRKSHSGSKEPVVANRKWSSRIA